MDCFGPGALQGQNTVDLAFLWVVCRPNPRGLLSLNSSISRLEKATSMEKLFECTPGACILLAFVAARRMLNFGWRNRHLGQLAVASINQPEFTDQPLCLAVPFYINRWTDSALLFPSTFFYSTINSPLSLPLFFHCLPLFIATYVLLCLPASFGLKVEFHLRAGKGRGGGGGG